MTALLKPMVCFVDHAMALVLSAEMSGKETMQEKENFFPLIKLKMGFSFSEDV